MFSNKLGKRAVKKGATADFILHDVGPMIEDGETPVLRVKPATVINRGYSDAGVKALAPYMKAKRMTTSLAAAARDAQRDLLADHVLIGWEHVYGDDDQVAPFSVENAHKFLEALPDHIFDDLLAFCSDISNFVSEADIAGN